MAASTSRRAGAAIAWSCYALLLAAWVVDLVTPQLFVVAILFNGPIALSSLALDARLTRRLVIAAEIANAIAGYVNGAHAGYQWDVVAVGDRVLLAASFLLVGYMTIKTQEFSREAGVSATRRHQVEIEKSLRAAIERIRTTLNVELILRGVLRESIALVSAAGGMLIVRETVGATPLVLSYSAGSPDVAYERKPLRTEIASLVERARGTESAFAVTAEDALGRMTLDALGDVEALVVAIRGSATQCVLIAGRRDDLPFSADALEELDAFADQARVALDQAGLFERLGAQNDEIARQKDELERRGEVIRDIVYALAHDLRTPLAAMDVTIKQALSGAYGELPERYRGILGSALASNEEERRIVETLLLVARYEAGEESTLREPVDLVALSSRVVEELQPVGEAKGVALTSEAPSGAVRTVGDSSELRRAIVNLVANAVEATPQGGHVVVRAARTADNAVVTVEDDGYGVAPERRDSLFARFGGTPAGGGTGLGLYIVRRIVEKHGGTVSYEPREPHGSIFTIVLPYSEE